MKIWIANITESLPVEKNATLDRFGHLAKALAAANHQVIWWASNFSPTQRRFICQNQREISKEGVAYRILSGRGYSSANGFGHWLHNRKFAEKYYLFARQASRPDFILTSVPTIEIGEVVVQFAKERRIPVLVDIRTTWPFGRIEKTPPGLRNISAYLLRNFIRKFEFACENATGITAASSELFNFGLSLARRDKRAFDGVFESNYEAWVQHINRVASEYATIPVEPAAQPTELSAEL